MSNLPSDSCSVPKLELPLKVCLLVGNSHALYCGVKDYAQRLAEALANRGIEAEVHAPPDWKLRSFLNLRGQLRATRFDVLHVQYPSIGFRYSLLPHLAGLTGIAPATCVTLHEYSRLPHLQRLSTHLFSFSTQAIFFTTEEEQKSFAGGAWKGRSSHRVVPIASNVPEAHPCRPSERVVLYFGQLRPDKGIEAFLELARLSLQTGATFAFRIIGACPPRHEEYLQQLRHNASKNVEWVIDAGLSEVALLMSSALAAYLPFPDGATYRRGSLIGALINGLPVISTCSHQTPASLAQVIMPANDPQHALECLKVLDSSPSRRSQISSSSRALGQEFSWTSIAEAHDLLYQRLLHRHIGSQ